MKYYELPLRPMQESGAFLLRAMQNEDMPRLDLLVRESVQNALDAALDRKPGGEIKISFKLRAHATETIASILAEGIDRQLLLARHPDGGRLLEIRDSLTEGLTGPTSFDEIGPDGVHGNLLKLVYEIGRTRGDADAGGSWGLGKTCYFRMGVGLVIYYSRIRVGKVYEERLVASLVEDEASPDRMQRETRTGIGWWGAEEGLKPVTGPTRIKRILEMLRIDRFTGAETGTSIIIPFLREDLVEALDADENGSAPYRPYWYDTYEEYIRIALERWFCARLDNPHFATGPSLSATVNGKDITAGKMLPVFRTVQALYNRAVGAQLGADDYLTSMGVPADAVKNQQVEPRSLFKKPAGPAGDVAAVLLTPEQLGMGAPFNHPDPAMCVFGRSGAEPPFNPLVTFMRRPGMCVSWDDRTDGRGWAGGMPGVADGRYLVAVFVPRQERVLANPGRLSRDDTHVTLDSYLRGCERADHAAWHDAAGLRVVEKIRLNCGRILRDFGTRPRAITAVSHSIRMARNLADLVLPERGMGTDGRSGLPTSTRPGGGGGSVGAGGSGGGSVTSGGSGGEGGRRAASAMPVLDLVGLDYTVQGLQVRWRLAWGSADRSLPRKICVQVDSESGPISSQQWLSDGLGMFPFRVSEAMIEQDAVSQSGVALEVDSDCGDGVVLRNSGDAPVGPLTGVLLIGLISGVPGAFRPVLSSILVDPVLENA